MCVCDIDRGAVQALPQEDIQALRQFATGRLAKAASDHAKTYWDSVILRCMPLDEYNAAMKVRYPDPDILVCGSITADSIPAADNAQFERIDRKGE